MRSCLCLFSPMYGAMLLLFCDEGMVVVLLDIGELLLWSVSLEVDSIGEDKCAEAEAEAPATPASKARCLASSFSFAFNFLKLGFD